MHQKQKPRQAPLFKSIASSTLLPLTDLKIILFHLQGKKKTTCYTASGFSIVFQQQNLCQVGRFLLSQKKSISMMYCKSLPPSIGR